MGGLLVHAEPGTCTKNLSSRSSFEFIILDDFSSSFRENQTKTMNKKKLRTNAGACWRTHGICRKGKMGSAKVNDKINQRNESSVSRECYAIDWLRHIDDRVEWIRIIRRTHKTTAKGKQYSDKRNKYLFSDIKFNFNGTRWHWSWVKFMIFWQFRAARIHTIYAKRIARWRCVASIVWSSKMVNGRLRFYYYLHLH